MGKGLKDKVAVVSGRRYRGQHMCLLFNYPRKTWVIDVYTQT